VLLFNSCLKIFFRKLKTRWSGPFTITRVFPYGTIKLSQHNGSNFKVNGHRVKHYFDGDIPSNVAWIFTRSPWTTKFEDQVKLSDSVIKNKALCGRIYSSLIEVSCVRLLSRSTRASHPLFEISLGKSMSLISIV
nr:reverse transcriptase domain-containing protein [Tanacetum cinerariifolium]